MHGFLISFTAPRIFPRSPDLSAGQAPGRLHAALPRPRSCCLVPAARRARKKPIRKATEKSNGRVFRTHARHTAKQIARPLYLCAASRFPSPLPGFPPLPGFAGRTSSRTLTRCGTAPSALLPCSGGAVCPAKANAEGNRKSNGRVFRTHAHYDVEQIAASVPLICPRHAAFIGFRNFICSYICRPCAPRMPHGFIIGCVGFVPALRIPPCPVLSSGAPVGRRPCAPKKHVFRI